MLTSNGANTEHLDEKGPVAGDKEEEEEVEDTQVLQKKKHNGDTNTHDEHPLEMLDEIDLVRI